MVQIYSLIIYGVVAKRDAAEDRKHSSGAEMLWSFSVFGKQNI